MRTRGGARSKHVLIFVATPEYAAPTPGEPALGYVFRVPGMLLGEPGAAPMRETDAGADRADAARAWARLGLTAATLGLVGLLFAIDVALSSLLARPPEDAGIPLSVRTHDGRMAGGDDWGRGIQLLLSPTTLYKNRPDQPAYGINSTGYRGPELRSRADRPRVVLIGGSTAFGLGVPARRTFAAVLQEQCPEIELINAAVVGYVTSQELGLALFELIDLHPALVVAFDGFNNLYDPYWRSTYDPNYPDDAATNAEFFSMEDRLAEHHRARLEPWAALRQAGRTLASRSTVLGAASRLLDHPPTFDPPAHGPEWVRRLAAGYVADMVKLRDVLGTRGAELLVAIQPEVGQLVTPARLEQVRRQGEHFLEGDYYWRLFPDLYAAFRKAALDSLAAAGVHTVDTSEELLPVFREGKALFSDPAHFNIRGHREVGALLKPHVARFVPCP